MTARSRSNSVTAETPLANLEFVAFDTETTGCESATGRIVEIGAVRFRLDGTEIGRYSQLINPLRPIPASVTAIHGITNTMTRDCPDEATVLPQFLDFLGDPTTTILMAHNAPFDLGFVGAGLSRCSLKAPVHAVIDTVRLSRRRAAGLPSHSLSSLVRIFGVADGTEHRGLADAIALKQVFLNLVHRPPSPVTAGELFAYTPASRFSARHDGSRRNAVSRSRRTSAGRSFGGEVFGRRAFDSSQSVCESSMPQPVSGESAAATAVDHGSQLSAAIAAGRFVSLVYDGGRSAGANRRVTPLRLIDSATVTYLVAFCHEDGKQKQYRLDRIRQLVVE